MRLWARCGLALGLLLLAGACGHSIPTAVPLVTFTPPAAPSSTPDEPATLAPSSTPAPSQEPSPSPTPPAVVVDSLVAYHPPAHSPDVAAVLWDDASARVFFALAPTGDQYLLNWYSFDLDLQAQRPVDSPRPVAIEKWPALGLGYPSRQEPYSELMGYLAPGGKYLLYPNAGFAQVYSNPNYIYLISTGSGARQPVLGPTFVGTLDRAVWIRDDNGVIFDYRYTGGRELFYTNLISGVTITLADLRGLDAVLGAQWQVAPDENMVAIPVAGGARIIALDGHILAAVTAPGGTVAPCWSADSRSLYFWTRQTLRLSEFNLRSETIRPILSVQDLVAGAPIAPQFGMPFAVSPDRQKIVFWLDNWVWAVTIRG